MSWRGAAAPAAAGSGGTGAWRVVAAVVGSSVVAMRWGTAAYCESRRARFHATLARHGLVSAAADARFRRSAGDVRLFEGGERSALQNSVSDRRREKRCTPAANARQRVGISEIDTIADSISHHHRPESLRTRGSAAAAHSAVAAKPRRRSPIVGSTSYLHARTCRHAAGDACLSYGGGSSSPEPRIDADLSSGVQVSVIRPFCFHRRQLTGGSVCSPTAPRRLANPASRAVCLATCACLTRCIRSRVCLALRPCLLRPCRSGCPQRHRATHPSVRSRSFAPPSRRLGERATHGARRLAGRPTGYGVAAA